MSALNRIESLDVLAGAGIAASVMAIAGTMTGTGMLVYVACGLLALGAGGAFCLKGRVAPEVEAVPEPMEEAKIEFDEFGDPVMA